MAGTFSAEFNTPLFKGAVSFPTDQCSKATSLYDDTAHILSVLFSPTTPAKFCFRAITPFCKHVTSFYQQSTSSLHSKYLSPAADRGRLEFINITTNDSNHHFTTIAALSRLDPSSSPLRSATDLMGQESPEGGNSKTRSKTTLNSSERYYESGSWDGKMIRERVSTKGVVRPLEPEDQLAATTYPPELLGTISEL
ncbi:hypothetical protein BDZ89DRAFT_1131010 [Hymenopellis radicata]|nr:hypothetical protein BDZ89DRAFT_1131010 [Hymenopellis radicata]